MVGRTIKHYEIESKLGQGGWIVFRYVRCPGTR